VTGRVVATLLEYHVSFHITLYRTASMTQQSVLLLAKKLRAISDSTEEYLGLFRRLLEMYKVHNTVYQ